MSHNDDVFVDDDCMANAYAGQQKKKQTKINKWKWNRKRTNIRTNSCNNQSEKKTLTNFHRKYTFSFSYWLYLFWHIWIICGCCYGAMQPPRNPKHISTMLKMLMMTTLHIHYIYWMYCHKWDFDIIRMSKRTPIFQFIFQLSWVNECEH